MKKAEFIQEVVAVGKENGLRLSQELVKGVLEAIEVVTDKVIQSEDTVIYNGVQFGAKEVAARKGTLKKENGEEIEWTTPAKISPYVKMMKSKRVSLEREK